MTVNEGTIDRTIRVVVGLGLLALAITGPQTPIGWIGVVPLATGLFGYCPLYQVLGLNTCPMKK